MISKIKFYLLPALAMMSMAAPVAKAEFAADYYTTTSALSSGQKWVKVKVTQNGMHQITDEQLLQMGFTNPEKVAVYGVSANTLNNYLLNTSHPDDVVPVPAIRHNGKLIFYGEGDVTYDVRMPINSSTTRYLLYVSRNYYADYGTYFLTESETGPLAPVQGALPNATTSANKPLLTSRGMMHYEREVQNSGEIGAQYLDVPFSVQPDQTYQFAMPGYNATGISYFQIFAGLVATTFCDVPFFTPDGKSANLSLGLITPSQYSYKGLSTMTNVRSADLPVADNGIYTARIKTSGTALSDGALDYFTATYPRNNTFTNNPADILVFTSLSSNRVVMVDNAPQQLMVWDITNRQAPRALSTRRYMSSGSNDNVTYTEDPEGNCVTFSFGSSVNISQTGGCAFALPFDPAADLFDVEYMGDVAPQNLHGLETPHMLIVTASAFKEQAERLAQLHRTHDGIDVAVVCQDDIYNEFSYGTPHLMGIRRFVHMLYWRNPEKLRSLLIFGAASYDARGLLVDQADFRAHKVPMYSCEDFAFSGSLPKSYITDSFVTMLDENATTFDIREQMQKINVGRIPCDNTEEARIMVDKIENYLTNPPTNDYFSRAVAMCDLGDRNTHMDDAEALTSQIFEDSPHTTSFKVYNTLYKLTNGKAETAANILRDNLSKGVGFVSFSGHAIPRSIGNGNMWTTDMVNEFEHDILPFYMLSTCRAIYYDHDNGSLGESLLFKDGGGAIAVVGANREVYKEQNKILNLDLSHQFFTAVPGTTFGDVFRVARNMQVPIVPPGNTDASIYDRIINTLSYNLSGDPELKLHVPNYKAAIENINGVDMEDITEIPAGVKLTVEGAVTNNANEIITDFNGVVYISFYDGYKTTKTVNYDNNDALRVDVTLDEDLILERTVEVINGRFTTELVLPTPYYADNGCRFVVYGVSDDMRRAHGGHRNLAVAPSTADELEMDAPVISSFYINNQSFGNGDVIGPDMMVYATIEPNEYGVSVSSSQFGRSMSLMLDNSQSYPTVGRAFTSDNHGGGTLAFHIGGMPDGQHTLTLRVVNAAGQDASSTISFNVVNSVAAPQITAVEFPARYELNINLTHNFNDEPEGRIIIKDMKGDVVYSKADATFPFCWDLKNNEGKNVADGYYEVTAYLRGGTFFGGTNTLRTVVRR